MVTRQMRRQAERNKNKLKIYNEKEITLSKEKIKEIKRQATDDAVDRMLSIMYVLPLLVMREQGWGRIRLQRFNDRMIDLINEVQEQRLDLNSIIEMMENKYKIRFKNDKE